MSGGRNVGAGSGPSAKLAFPAKLNGRVGIFSTTKGGRPIKEPRINQSSPTLQIRQVGRVEVVLVILERAEHVVEQSYKQGGE